MLPRLTAASLAVVAAACGAAGNGAGDPEGPEIADVDILGNDAVGDDELIDGLETHGPTGIIFKDYARYDPVLVDRDVKRIRSYYQRQGYFSARVIDTDVRDLGERVEVRFEVIEGKPAEVIGVDITGLPERVRNDPEIVAIESSLEGERIFDNQRYLEAKSRLRERLGARGYAWADVDGVVRVHRDKRIASIEIQARPGPLVRFGEVRIDGLDQVPEEAVRARLAWEPGDVYDPAKLDETRSQLYELGFFNGVRLEIAGRPEGELAETTTAVNLILAEVPDHEVRLGAGFAIDTAHYEARTRAGYTQHHFLDPLATLRLDLRPAYTVVRNDTAARGFGGEGSAAIDRHDLFAHRVHGEVKVAYRQSELETYTSRGPGLRLTLGRPFWDGALRAGVGWEIRRLTFPEVHPAIDMATAAEIGLIDPYRIAFFDQLVAFDRRDNILDPREGYYLELRLEESGTWSGSEFDYVMATTEARGYWSPFRRLVGAVRLGAGEAIAGDLPITRRFFGGGAAGHRGFGNRQLSPTVSMEDPETGEILSTQIGDSALFLASAEVRLDVYKLWTRWLGVATFVDAGDVLGTLPDLGTPHVAAGVGLRYDTLVGPVRIDVAYRLNRTGAGEPEPNSRWAYHLSLGEAF